jgi:hypothetical protein
MVLALPRAERDSSVPHTLLDALGRIAPSFEAAPRDPEPMAGKREVEVCDLAPPNFPFAKNNRPIGLNRDIQRKRSEIKPIGRLFSA